MSFVCKLLFFLCLLIRLQSLPISPSSSRELALGEVACVTGTNHVGLKIHSGPCTTDPVLWIAFEGDSFNITDGPVTQCGFTWYKLQNRQGIGWAASSFLETCGGSNWNAFGIGLVDPGNTQELDFAVSLSGDQGWILLLFAGIDVNSNAPQSDWVAALNGAYQRNLNPVIRLSPPWGQQWYRDESDDSAHRNYTSLSQAFRSVVAGLPLKEGQNIYFQIDNEPDLCPEWYCRYAGSPYSYTEQAAEYASFLVYTLDAIHSLGDPRHKVSLGALAPGGNIQCGCCGQQNCDNDLPGITGLQFMEAMSDAEPIVFTQIDFLASHSYPASGIGYGFGAPYGSALPGLQYYELELDQINRSCQVIITETGWATNAPGEPTCSEDDKATWTTEAYSGVWLADNRIMGVTPFILMDAYWGDQVGYGYVSASGTVKPVYNSVQSQRCSLGFPGGSCG